MPLRSILLLIRRRIHRHRDDLLPRTLLRANQGLVAGFHLFAVVVAHNDIPAASDTSDKKRNTGTQAMDDAGEGIPVFQLVPTKSFGKQSLDMGNP